jgi:hypothetical protein
VWSLLKFFALTFAATWTCFIAAVAISHGSASTDPRLAVIRGLVFVGTFATALVAPRAHRRRRRKIGDKGTPPSSVPVASGCTPVSLCRRLYGGNYAHSRARTSRHDRLMAEAVSSSIGGLGTLRRDERRSSRPPYRV